MEGSVNVNAGLPSDDSPDLQDDFPEGPPPSQSAADLGPCLYLGAAGQRCSRRAVEDGFCARHQPAGAQILSVPQISRRTVAVLGLLAVLWPVLADLIRELMRLLR